MGRAPCCEKVGLKKGAWTPEEDQKLVNYINENGHGSWRALPKKAGLLRCGKSCRLRWTNYLRPDIKRGEFSASEEQTIIQLHALLGNRWSAIASHLPKRTDNEIKNYWNTHLKKRLSKMGIDPTTHKPKSDILSSNSALVGVDGTGAAASNSALSHMVQWESARLAAEARLARESRLRTEGLWRPTSTTTTSSSISNNSSPLEVEAQYHHQRCYHPSTEVAGTGAASGAGASTSSTTHLVIQGEPAAGLKLNAIELMNTLQNWEKSLQGQAGLMWPDSWRSSSAAAGASLPPPPPQPAASATDNSTDSSSAAGLMTSCCSSPPYSHSATQPNYTSSCCNVDKQLDQASSPTSTLCTSSWPEYYAHSDNHRRCQPSTSSLDRHFPLPHEAAAAHCSSPSNTSAICSTAAAATNIIVSPKLSWSDILPSAAAAPVPGFKPAIIDILRQSRYSYVSSGVAASCSAEGSHDHHTGELRAESMTTPQLGAQQLAAASPTSFQDLLFEVVSRPWASSSSSCQYSGPSLLDSNCLKQQQEEEQPQQQLELEDHSHNSATTPSLRHEQLIGEFADISSDADMSSCCVKSNEDEEDPIMADLSKSFIASTSSSRPVTFSALLNEDFPDYWSNMLKDVHADDVVDGDAPRKIIHVHMSDHPTKESNGES